MDRRQLEYFLAVVEAGSFTRAAASLNIAQPSLSHTIAAMERELGAPLFERLGRGVKLTPSGQAMVDPARRTLRSFALVQRAVRSATAVGYGRLTIVTNTLWAIEPLTGVIGEFRRTYPQVHFSVIDPRGPFEVLDAVRSGVAELGLIDGTPPGGPLSSQWVVSHELVAVVPPGALPENTTATVADLFGLGIVGTPQGTALRALVDAELQAYGETPELAVETAHVATVIPLVLSGAGATILPRGMAEDAAAKGARVMALEGGSRSTGRLRVPISLVWRTNGLSTVGEEFRRLMATLARDAAAASHSNLL